jgi:hypothetical protein
MLKAVVCICKVRELPESLNRLIQLYDFGLNWFVGGMIWFGLLHYAVYFKL